MSYLDFKNAIDTIEDIISSGFKRKTSISSFITKCLKNSETGLLSIGGTRTTVKELVGVATSSPTKLSTLYKRILSNSTKGSLINSILPIFSGNAGLIISIAIDIIFGSVVDVCICLLQYQ